MNRTLLGFLIWCSASLSLAATPPDRTQIEVQLHDRTRFFEPNTGHLEQGVDFVARTLAMEATLRSDGAEFAVSGNRERLRLRLPGARKASAVGLERQKAVTFYLMDRKKPTAAAPHYGRVRYPKIYPGIDIVYYFQGQNIEYDLVVKPGADTRAIRLVYDGSLKTSITRAGELAIQTSSGDFKQLPPRVYQQQGNATVEVPAPLQAAWRWVRF